MPYRTDASDPGQVEQNFQKSFPGVHAILLPLRGGLVFLIEQDAHALTQ